MRFETFDGPSRVSAPVSTWRHGVSVDRELEHKRRGRREKVLFIHFGRLTASDSSLPRAVTVKFCKSVCIRFGRPPNERDSLLSRCDHFKYPVDITTGAATTCSRWRIWVCWREFDSFTVALMGTYWFFVFFRILLLLPPPLLLLLFWGQLYYWSQLLPLVLFAGMAWLDLCYRRCCAFSLSLSPSLVHKLHSRTCAYGNRFPFVLFVPIQNCNKTQCTTSD